MASKTTAAKRLSPITLALLPTPYKVLATCIIATLTIGMLGALGQIIVHDIIPTFFSGAETQRDIQHENMEKAPIHPTREGRGDLFAELSAEDAEKGEPIYKSEQFVWTLRWTHIHLFGINMIFIFLGAITALLNARPRVRVWLIALPFLGVLIDVLAMWLKAFVSPVFFWLHIPGGGIFATVFGYVALRALWEMWIKPANAINAVRAGN